MTGTQHLDKDKLSKWIREASAAYYGPGEPIATDEEFDIMCYFLRKLDPTNPIFAEVGAAGEGVRIPQ